MEFNFNLWWNCIIFSCTLISTMEICWMLHKIKRTSPEIFHLIVKKLKNDGLVTPCSLRVFKTAFVPARKDFWNEENEAPGIHNGSKLILKKYFHHYFWSRLARYGHTLVGLSTRPTPLIISKSLQFRTFWSQSKALSMSTVYISN